MNFWEHVCILKPQWSVFKAWWEREKEARLTWRQYKSKTLKGRQYDWPSRECYTSSQAPPFPGTKQPSGYECMTCECIHLFTNWTTVLLILRILKTLYALSHFPPNLEILLCFFSAQIWAEMRYALFPFAIQLFAAQVIFLLFKHLFVVPSPLPAVA